MQKKSLHTMEELQEWLDDRYRNHSASVKLISLDECKPWYYDEDSGQIRNEKGTFFRISGIRQYINGEVTAEQPIIIQNEIGFLGILTCKIDGIWYYLMQAKIEPGNVNVVQISPTLQILWLGYDHDVVKYVRKQRREGEGKGKWTFAKKFKLLSDSFISFTYIPIRLMWIIGLLFSIFAVIMAVIIFMEYFTKGTPVAGWNTLMCVVLLAFGLILWMLGLLEEYIWRIFDSSRNRKPFVIDVVKNLVKDRYLYICYLIQASF